MYKLHFLLIFGFHFVLSELVGQLTECSNLLQTLEYPCKETFSYPLNISLNEESINGPFKLFSHMAYLGYGGSLDEADWLCGGTVISKRFILTAAECVEPDYSVGRVRFVALGLYKRWVSPSGWQRYNVKRAIPHPEYGAHSKYHDIALIETDRDIIFGPNVLPACLDSSNQEVPEANTIIWSEGQIGTLDFTKIKNLVYRCPFSNTSQPTLKNGYNFTTQMCYGDTEKPKDTYEGEIGSPLQSTFRYCFHKVLGVASIKRECGEAGSFGLFTRVSFYLPWIKSIVWS